MVNKEHMELWIQALESEGYTQCKEKLRLAAVDVTQEPAKIIQHHCALGVGVEIALQNGVSEYYSMPWTNRIPVWEAGTFLPSIMEFYGLDESDPTIEWDGCEVTVAGANDDGVPFWDIAQALRAQYLKEE